MIVGAEFMVKVLELAGSRMGLRRLELVLAISDAEVRSRQEIMTEQFEDLHVDYVTDWHVLQADLRWMGAEDWIRFEASAAGIQGVHLLGPGQRAAQRFSDARSDSVARIKQARDSVLRWLYECDVADIRSPQYQDFKDSKHGAYLGKQFTSGEITKVISWLENKELVTGEYMAGVGYYTNVRIAAAGSDVVEEYGSMSNVPKECHPNITNTTVHMNGSHGSNLNISGDNVTQSTAVTLEQVAEASKFVESARGLIPMLKLDAGKAEELAEIVDDVEAETKLGAPKKNVLIELIAKSRDLAVLGAASSFVTAFEGITNTALAAMGG